MPTHAGDKAEETGTFTCKQCGETVRVHKGEKVPSCPNCGHNAFGPRSDEPTEREPSPERKGD